MWLNLKIVKNYSFTLFGVAKATSKEKEILEQLNLFSECCNSNMLIGNVISSPIIDKAIKIKLIDFISDKYKFERISRRFLHVLIKNDRYILLPKIVDHLDELIKESNGIKTARVVSAFKLNTKETEAIENMLQAWIGLKINLQTAIDKSLIGGAIIKYDSNLIDYSVLGALTRIKKLATKVKI
jgi:F-type H+-transporting ATPase subunit delta